MSFHISWGGNTTETNDEIRNFNGQVLADVRNAGNSYITGSHTTE